MNRKKHYFIPLLSNLYKSWKFCEENVIFFKNAEKMFLLGKKKQSYSGTINNTQVNCKWIIDLKIK